MTFYWFCHEAAHFTLENSEEDYYVVLTKDTFAMFYVTHCSLSCDYLQLINADRKENARSYVSRFIRL